jgi:hypothetical protein
MPRGSPARAWPLHPPITVEGRNEPAIDDAEHAELIRQAQEAARQGQWELAVQLLQHNALTEEVPMAWPNYNIPVPASLILNEIIYRASIAQPANLAGIISAAINCSVNMHLHHPALQHTEASGSNPGTPALDQRIVNALKRASTASSGADWIYVENELNHD